jgi:hypothetical protein
MNHVTRILPRESRAPPLFEFARDGRGPIAFLAQSSQQTVISFSPTLTLIPPSVISQSHTGHFFVFIRQPRNTELNN